MTDNEHSADGLGTIGVIVGACVLTLLGALTFIYAASTFSDIGTHMAETQRQAETAP